MDKKYGHTIDGIETGDYIQLHGEEIGEWFKITNTDDTYFDCKDDFGRELTQMKPSAIADLKLPSEMDYAF